MAIRGRIALLYAAYCAGVVLVAFGLGELAARALGAAPWSPQAPGIRVEPGGRLYTADPLLGYRMLPGRYRIRFDSGYAFTATHGDDSLRVTREGPRRAEAEGRGLWIFGCSFTYGWSVDDRDVYATRLQRRLPDRDVVNWAVNGYGTIQAVLQLERALAAGGRPETVVLAHAAFHADRNTFVRARRKRVAPFSALGPLVQPYARIGPDGGLVIAMAEVTYRPWPGMRRSALIHLAEQRWNAVERTRADPDRVTRALVSRFVERAAASGARVFVAGIAGDTRGVLEHAARAGATPIDLAIDLDQPGMRNLPHDAHPSARAHARYADRLLHTLTTTRGRDQ